MIVFCSIKTIKILKILKNITEWTSVMFVDLGNTSNELHVYLILPLYIFLSIFPIWHRYL